MAGNSLFSDYLTALGVPHTCAYSTSRFQAYPHKLALAGVEDLLDEYKVGCTRFKSGQCDDPTSLKVPFIAGTKSGYVIVTGNNPAESELCFQSSDHKIEKMKYDDFRGIWTGDALTADASAESCEPDLEKHRLRSASDFLCKWGLVAIAAGLVIYWFISNGVWHNWGDVVNLVLYGLGIYITYLLILKDSHVASNAADSVCGVIQANGCATVLSTSSSALFGVFPWCEIGFAYFTVSFTALLVGGPECAEWLPWIALCCLPYTVWSVLEQKFRIHAWCTLCLCVQTLFWLIAATYLFSGDFRNPMPFDWGTVALLVSYAGAFMLIHRLVPLIFRYERSAPVMSNRL